MSWWERLSATDFGQLVFNNRGIDMASDVLAVTPGQQEDGAEFLALRIRSSREDKLVENIATCYLRPDRTLEQFRESIQQSREWFADQFAQELLGIAPPRPVHWRVVTSNPADPQSGYKAWPYAIQPLHGRWCFKTSALPLAYILAMGTVKPCSGSWARDF